MKVCENCGEAKIHGRGLCGKCYEYQRKYGKPRPLETKRGGKRRDGYTGDTCRNCGDEGEIKACDLCNKCYEYQRRHSAPRPLSTKRGAQRRAYTGDACRNCGAGGKLSLGLCKNCYGYTKRHDGAMRPLDKAVMMAARRKHTHCTHCGAADHKGHGLCKKCYDYLRNHGTMRPTEPQPKVLCVRCKQSVAAHKTKRYGLLCNKCANYFYLTGKPRPRQLWAESCANCGKPHGDSQPRSGLCNPCRQYRTRYGKPRPAYLWGKGTHGWCECGAAAEHIITVKIHNHVDKIAVCDACYAEEMRMSAVYGGVSAQKDAALHCER